MLVVEIGADEQNQVFVANQNRPEEKPVIKFKSRTSRRGSMFAAVMAGLNMVRAENLNRTAHTHYVKLSNGQVTPLENGFQISGPATITSNGNLAGFSGSTVTVKVTGGNAVI